jgi:hypothetical protein
VAILVLVVVAVPKGQLLVAVRRVIDGKNRWTLLRIELRLMCPFCRPARLTVVIAPLH